MGRRSLLAAILSVGAAGACGLDLQGTGLTEGGPGVSSPGDGRGSLDATYPDGSASFESGVADDAGDAPQSAPDSASDGMADAMTDARALDARTDADPTIVYDCPGHAPAGDCAQCQGKPLGCVFCSILGLTGRCIDPVQDKCSDVIPVPYAMCPCSAPSASACPMSFQVCRPHTPVDQCLTCGEQNADQRLCKSGGTCTSSTRTCN